MMIDDYDNDNDVSITIFLKHFAFVLFIGDALFV